MAWPDLNLYIDRMTLISIRVGRRRYSAFRVWGSAAFALALLLGVVLGIHRRLPLWTLILAIALGLSSFFALAFLTKIATGVESLTFYHQLLAATTVIAVAQWLLQQPVLLTTDIAVIAIGATLTFGRIGCLMVGCCHGRPCRVGVRYGAEHAAAGFTAELVGVRLFPVQIIEFLFALIITPVGCLMIWNGAIPGAAAAWYIATYCSARYCFEFARWPANYRFKSGLSQYQWISVGLVFLCGCLELAGVLPFRLWHLAALGVLLLLTAATVIERRLRSALRLLSHPEHVRELAAAIERASGTSLGAAVSARRFELTTITVGCTSLGVQISSGKIDGQAEAVQHYALSSTRGEMIESSARWLAGTILDQKRLAGRSEILKGSRGVFHLLVHPLNR